MVPADFVRAAQRLCGQLPQPARLRRLVAEWTLITTWLREDCLTATDALYSAWTRKEVALGLGAFLRRCRLVETEDPGVGSWQPAQAEIDEIGRDCLAVAYYRLYIALNSAPPGLRRAGAAGDGQALNMLWTADLAQALELVLAVASATADPHSAGESSLGAVVGPAVVSTLAWHRATPEFEALDSALAHWQREQAAASLTEPARILLALVLLAVNEEVLVMPDPIRILAAGPRGGVAEVVAAALTAHVSAPARVEWAPWSRYHPQTADLSGLLDRMTSLVGEAIPGVRYRLACNPPGIAPAAPGHIATSEPAGESIGFALALAVYAARQSAVLGRYAVTGAIRADLTIAPVDQAADKLDKLAAYNALSAVHVVDVLLPEKNCTPEIRRQAATLGLRLNQTRGGTIAVTDLRAVLQPGILFDGLQDYVAAVVRARSAEAALISNPVPDRRTPARAVLNESQRLADQVLEDLAPASPEGPLDTSQRPLRAYLLPLPPGEDTRSLSAYIAVQLAHRRLRWGREQAQWGSSSVVGSRAPAPVVLDAAQLEIGPEAAIAQQLQELTGRTDLQSYVCTAWRSLTDEFALILSGPDDLVERYLSGDQGLLAANIGLGAREGRHVLILLAQSLEQLHVWAEALARAGESLNKPVRTWYPRGQPAPQSR